MALVISRSLWQQLLVMSLAIVVAVLLYEVSTFDSPTVPPTATDDASPLFAGTRYQFTATAYCKGTTTASGVAVRTGIAAADPVILPAGSVVHITTGAAMHDGVYTILDTGPKVQKRLVDIYMWSCYEALAFGRRPIELTILRLGWNPAHSVPSLVDQLFPRREADRATMPAMPPAADVPAVDDEADGTTPGIEPAGADGVEPTSADGYDSTVESRAPDEPSSPDPAEAEPPDSPSPTVATAPDP